MLSQATKKAMKHNARLPRTAGLKTLSELSTSLTKAGLDPSRIEQRAELIAKARGLERKRKRDEEMDVDEEGDSEEGEDGEGEDGGDWMDVDGEGDGGRSPPKRRKSNTGTAVTTAGKHAPRTNRQTSGMRDQSQVSKAVKLRNLGQRERNMHARAGESDRAIKTKMVGCRDQREFVSLAHHDRFVAEALVFWKTKSRKDTKTMRFCFHPSPPFISYYRCTLLSFAFRFSCISCLRARIRNLWSPSCFCAYSSYLFVFWHGFCFVHVLPVPFHKIYLYHAYVISHDPRYVGKAYRRIYMSYDHTPGIYECS